MELEKLYKVGTEYKLNSWLSRLASSKNPSLHYVRICKYIYIYIYIYGSMLILHKTLIYFICQDKKRMEGGYIGVINSDIPYIYVNNVF